MFLKEIKKKHSKPRSPRCDFGFEAFVSVPLPWEWAWGGEYLQVLKKPSLKQKWSSIKSTDHKTRDIWPSVHFLKPKARLSLVMALWVPLAQGVLRPSCVPYKYHCSWGQQVLNQCYLKETRTVVVLPVMFSDMHKPIMMQISIGKWVLSSTFAKNFWVSWGL